MPRILLDVDGVLADFVGSFLYELRDITGVKYTREQVTEWQIEKALNLAPAVVSEAYERTKRQHWCFNIAPYPGAREGVKALREAGLNLRICTTPMAKSKHWMPERVEWLWNYFGFKESEIIFTYEKHAVYADAIVDDKIATLRDWVGQFGFGGVKATPFSRGYAIAWDTPHNQTEAWPLRAKSWKHLHDLLVGE
jgi:5'(3')-deoxyribonucleotidase